MRPRYSASAICAAIVALLALTHLHPPARASELPGLENSRFAFAVADLTAGDHFVGTIDLDTGETAVNPWTHTYPPRSFADNIVGTDRYLLAVSGFSGTEGISFAMQLDPKSGLPTRIPSV